MKIGLPIFLAALVLFGCKKEDEEGIVITEGPTVSAPYSMLHYDASNMDAPLLGAGTFEGAARFSASQVNSFVGGELSKIWYYMKDLPESAEVRVYQADPGSSSPDSLLYSANLTGDMEAGRWNDHVIPNPLVIPDKDIWISIRVVHNSDTRSLGCDPGPAVDNGDKMWTSTGGQWITLRQFDGTNINWNIRTVVKPQ